MRVKVPPIEIVVANVPIPRPVVPPTMPRSAVYAALLNLGTNETLDVNRTPKTCRTFFYRLRQRYDVGYRFIARQLRPGWSRIWRIE